MVDVVRRRDEVTYVYNVEIEGLHTYFVSGLEVLSHNMCGRASTPVGRRNPIGGGLDAPKQGGSGAGAHTPQHKNSPLQPTQNRGGNVNGREYSGHAFDEMRNRGLVPSVVENTIQTGIKSPGSTPGITKIHDPVNNVTVILNEHGKVVTAY